MLHVRYDSRMPRFPAHALRPRRGAISALLFENPHVGLARGLFWSVIVTFEPLEYAHGGDTETFDCNAQVEWLQLGIRDWRHLEGREVRSARPGEGFEASFYTVEHDWSEETRVRFSDREGASFVVELDMRVDFSGWYEGDADPALPVSAKLRAEFGGIMIDGDIIEPVAGQEARVLEVVRPFADLDTYEAPRLLRNSWYLEPRGAN